MRFGIWHDFRNPSPWHRPWDVLYRENIDLTVRAEELGFESVWLSEHHATDDGYLPSLFPMLAALAERTRTLRLGTAVLLAPFQHPLRFAEDAAVIDQLSAGRLELGLGAGYRPLEFEALGLPLEDRFVLTERLISEARRIWSGQHEVVAMPPPFQQPEPPLWLGGATRAAARRAARLRCHFFPDAHTPTEVIELYRETLRSQGDDPLAFSVAVNPSIYVSDDPERGWAEVKAHYLYQYNRYREWGGGEVLRHADELPRDRYIVGTADHVVEAIRAIKQRTGCDRLIFWARPPGLPTELAERSIELFAGGVIREFGDS